MNLVHCIKIYNVLIDIDIYHNLLCFFLISFPRERDLAILSSMIPVRLNIL